MQFTLSHSILKENCRSEFNCNREMGIFIFKTEQNTTELLIYFNKLIYGVYLCLRLYIEYLLYLGYWNIYTDIFKVSNERQLVSVLSVCVVLFMRFAVCAVASFFSFVVACAVRTLSWRCLVALFGDPGREQNRRAFRAGDTER